MPQGLLLHARLTPKAAHNGVDGVKAGPRGPCVQARVRAAPEDGRANAALVELVADEIGVPKSTVAVVAGHSARMKSLHVAGDAAALERKVMTWLARLT